MLDKLWKSFINISLIKIFTHVLCQEIHMKTAKKYIGNNKEVRHRFFERLLSCGIRELLNISTFYRIYFLKGFKTDVKEKIITSVSKYIGIMSKYLHTRNLDGSNLMNPK